MKKIISLILVLVFAAMALVSCNSSTTTSTPTATSTAKVPLYIPKQTLFLFVNESTYITATETKDLEWTSSDPSVLTVDENGNVAALKKGSVTVKVKNKIGEESTTSVTVIDALDYIKLANFEGLTVLQSKLDDAMAEEYKYMSEYYATKSAVDRASKDGDTLSITYSGKLDGETEVFEGGSGTTDLVLGSHTMIDGFEEGLIGYKAGETAILNLTFPEDYKDPETQKELADKFNGKKVTFSVIISNVYELIPAEVNDELVSKATNKTYTTVAQYDEYLKKGLFEILAMDEAIAASEISGYDDAFISYYNDVYIQNSFGTYASYYNMTAKEFAIAYYGYTEASLTAEATEKSKAYLDQLYVIYGISEAYDVSVPEDFKTESIKDFATENGFDDSAEVLEKVPSGYIENYVLIDYVETMVYDWISLVDNTTAVPTSTAVPATTATTTATAE